MIILRALDIEGYSNHARLRDSQLWVLGAKFGEVAGNPYMRAEGGQTLLLGGLLNNFGCSTWNETAETGSQCTAFRFADATDASVIGYYATEYDPDCQNATVAVWESDGGTWLSANGSSFPSRETWWGQSHPRVGYHLPYFRVSSQG